MWPRDRTRNAECLRIGRHAVERWKSADGGLALHGEQTLPQDPALQSRSLVDAITALYPSPAERPITLILESAWLPVLLVDTGASLLRTAQLEALARHRFGLHHSDNLDAVAGWELRIEHRVGNRYALAYGLAPQLKQTLMDAARASKLEWAAMSPALSWGLERLRPAKTWMRSTGWWLWPEQDRTLVARIVANEVAGFNPGARRAADEADLLSLIEAESARLGVDSTADSIAAATWITAPRVARAGERFVWHEIQGQRGLLAPSRATTATRAAA